MLGKLLELQVIELFIYSLRNYLGAPMSGTVLVPGDTVLKTESPGVGVSGACEGNRPEGRCG